MKRYILQIVVLVFCNLFFSCGESSLIPSYELVDDFQIRIGDINELSGDDILYYDQSSHLFYVNKIIDIDSKEFNLKFWLTSAGKTYLDGYINYILNPCNQDTSYFELVFPDSNGYPDYTLLLQYKVCKGINYFNRRMDWENQPFIEKLKAERKLRKGLNVKFDTIQLNAPNEVSMTIEITNNDTINYYYPDVDKMGNDWYSGLCPLGDLTLFDSENNKFKSNQVATMYGDYSVWNKDWLSLVKAGDTTTMTITYDKFDSISPGIYSAFFDFRGLSYHVRRISDLELENGRVWLGKIELAKIIELK